MSPKSNPHQHRAIDQLLADLKRDTWVNLTEWSKNHYLIYSYAGPLSLYNSLRNAPRVRTAVNFNTHRLLRLKTADELKANFELELVEPRKFRPVPFVQRLGRLAKG